MERDFTPRYSGYVSQPEAAYYSGVGDPYSFSIILRKYRGPIKWIYAETLFPDTKYRYDEIISEKDFEELNRWVQEKGIPLEQEHRRKAAEKRKEVYATYGWKIGEAIRRNKPIPEPKSKADYILYRCDFPLPEGGEYTEKWELILNKEKEEKEKKIKIYNASENVKYRKSNIDRIKRNIEFCRNGGEPYTDKEAISMIAKAENQLREAENQLRKLKGQVSSPRPPEVIKEKPINLKPTPIIERTKEQKILDVMRNYNGPFTIFGYPKNRNLADILGFRVFGKQKRKLWDSLKEE